MKSFRQFKYLTEQNEDRTQTIRNLLALASRPGTPEEGIAAREHAERLAAKYGIDIATITPEDAPKPRAGTSSTPPQQPPIDPYVKMLRTFGWRPDNRPYRAFIHPTADDLRGHCIVVDENGWQHLVSGNPRYTGRNPRDLYHHMCYNVM